VYQVTITSLGGVTTVDMLAGAAINSLGSPSLAAVQLSTTYDLTSPSVTLSDLESDPTNSASWTVTATFSKAVTGVAIGDFSVTNGSASAFNAISTTVYEVTITPAGDGVTTVDTSAGAALDAAGNSSLVAVQLSTTYDVTNPNVTLSDVESDPTKSGSWTVTATFDEAVTGVAIGDFSVTNGSASAFNAVSTTVYEVTITPAAYGSVSVDMAAAAAIDSATNSSNIATQLSTFYDNISPVVTIDAVAVINIANETAYTVTGTCSIGDGNVTYLVHSPSAGTDATASVACSGGGIWTTTAINVSAVNDNALVEFDASQTDAALNSTSATQLTKLKDTAAPTISSVSSPANNTYYINNTIDFIATFSRVVNVTGTRLAFNIGSSTEYATYLSGTGSTSITYRYTVKLYDEDTDGVVLASALDLNGGLVVDLSANVLNPLTFTLPDTSGVLVNAVSPTLTSVTVPVAGSYTDTNNLDFTVNYDRIVDVVGSPRISINVGGSAVYATYNSGTGSSSLKFRYTVAPGQYDSDGITLSSPIDLNSGTIRSTTASDAFLGFTLPDTSGILVDGILYAGIDIPMSAMRASAFNYATLGGSTTLCTASTINGDMTSVGAFTNTSCSLSGTNDSPTPAGVITGLSNAYNEILAETCDTTLTGTLAGVTLAPGVHCFAAAATTTGTLTLSGPADGVWIIKAGGAFTATTATVVMVGGGQACNVYWGITGAYSATGSVVKGTVITFGALSATATSVDGNLLSLAALSLITGAEATACPNP
jgi:hypothetical protein